MNEADPLDAAVSLLYETVLDDSRWEAAMAALGQAFDAPMVARWRFDFKSGTATDFHGLGHDPGVQQRYTAHYHQFDPGAARVYGATVGQWHGDEALFDRRAPANQAYTVDFARPSDIGWVGGGKLEGNEPHAGLWFGVQRNFDDRPFGVDGERIFQRLAPHLQRVSRLQERLDHLAIGHALAQAALDALGSAVFVVDASGRHHFVNRAADRLLGAAGPLSSRAGRLAARPAAQAGRLAAGIAAACAPLPRGSAMALSRSDGRRPLQALVLPMPLRHELTSLRPEPLALLFVTDPDTPHLAPETYQALFRLTPAEAGLVAALVNGSTVAEWAAARGVRVSTIRTQLNAVFAKTGADSQPRLIRIAKALPSMG